MIMATAHFTRKVRSDRNRTSKSRPAGAKSPPATPPIDRKALRDGLKEHANTLRNAMYVAITCCKALSDSEEEIEAILRLYCGNKLYRAIRETGVLLALLDGKTGLDPESEEIMRLTDP
jgi:hypothetical protein